MYIFPSVARGFDAQVFLRASSFLYKPLYQNIGKAKTKIKDAVSITATRTDLVRPVLIRSSRVKEISVIEIPVTVIHFQKYLTLTKQATVIMDRIPKPPTPSAESSSA